MSKGGTGEMQLKLKPSKQSPRVQRRLAKYNNSQKVKKKK